MSTDTGLGEILRTSGALLELDAKWLQPFDVQDPINDDIRLQGALSIRPDHRYGALAITHVAGRPAPQRVFATPKLHYPFDKNGAFHFPPARSIRIYEKLDGTNVLAYRYRDADERAYTSYKLRLHPVLRNGKWGPFLDMWREMIARYPVIPQLAAANDCSVSFELYGAHNPHLVVYDTPLDCALLFGVDASGNAIEPSLLQSVGMPGARLWGELRAGEDPVAEYGRIREAMEKSLQKLDDGTMRGAEGTVWYVTDAAGRVHLFKCKPESVEAIHWATGINKQAVIATCWNLLETADALTYDNLLPLLLEEYLSDDIERFRPHIDECIAFVNAHLAFRDRVVTLYRQIGILLDKDRAACMRALSPHFRRDEMKRVYSVLATFLSK
jgi:hypothetical protein